MTKTILMAASALSLLAAPAFAQSSQTLDIQGSVDGMCGVANQSGGGVVTGNTPVVLGSLIDGNGFLSVAAKTIQFQNIWCNGPADVTVSASALSTPAAVVDTSSFVNTLDMHVTGSLIDTYLGGGEASTGSDLFASVGAAFETGTGTYAQATLNVTLPAGTSGNDRPIAGDYAGTVTITATAN